MVVRHTPLCMCINGMQRNTKTWLYHLKSELEHIVGGLSETVFGSLEFNLFFLCKFQTLHMIYML